MIEIAKKYSSLCLQWSTRKPLSPNSYRLFVIHSIYSWHIDLAYEKSLYRIQKLTYYIWKFQKLNLRNFLVWWLVHMSNKLTEPSADNFDRDDILVQTWSAFDLTVFDICFNLTFKHRVVNHLQSTAKSFLASLWLFHQHQTLGPAPNYLSLNLPPCPYPQI